MYKFTYNLINDWLLHCDEAIYEHVAQITISFVGLLKQKVYV